MDSFRSVFTTVWFRGEETAASLLKQPPLAHVQELEPEQRQRGRYCLVATSHISAGQLIMVERSQVTQRLLYFNNPMPLADRFFEGWASLVKDEEDDGADPRQEKEGTSRKLTLAQHYVKKLRETLGGGDDNDTRLVDLLKQELVDVSGFDPTALDDIHDTKALGQYLTELRTIPLTLAACGRLYALGVFDGPISRCNHSCQPNALFSGHQDWLMLWATHDIPVGQEITVSYVHHVPWLPQWEVRQRALQAAHGFVCACVRCNTERVKSDDIPDDEIDFFNKTLMWRYEMLPWFKPDHADRTMIETVEKREARVKAAVEFWAIHKKTIMSRFPRVIPLILDTTGFVLVPGVLAMVSDKDEMSFTVLVNTMLSLNNIERHFPSAPWRGAFGTYRALLEYRYRQHAILSSSTKNMHASWVFFAQQMWTFFWAEQGSVLPYQHATSLELLERYLARMDAQSKQKKKKK